MAGSLGALLSPGSVAILGASDDPTRIGGRPLAYLRAAGFAGPIYPVNPGRATVQGLAAYASVADLPATPEAAIVALPAALVEDAVTALAARGTRACIVFASGYAEIGDGAAQARLAAIARGAGIRILGPNCLGVFDVAGRFYATFSTTLDRGVPDAGGLSIVSQSGAFGSHLYYLARARGLGMRSWMTTGNEADVTMAECLEHLAQDPATRVIMAYAEGIRDADRLVGALELARDAGKPVVFMKVGRSDIGAEAASSHTAALAGEDAVCDAVLRQYGAHRARTTQELVDIAHAVSASPLPRGRRLGIVTISGGVGVLMADAAAETGLEVPPMPEPAQAALKAQLPFAGVRNPIDITAQAFNDPSLLPRNLDVVLSQGGYDAVVAFLTSVPGSAANAAPVREALASVRKAHPDFPLILSMLVPDALRRDYEAMGYPVFEDPSAAVAAVAAAARLREGFEQARPAAPLAPEPVSDTVRAALAAGRALDEHAAKQVLAAAGIPVPQDRLATTPDEAEAAWRAVAGPVALKLVSPDIAHKTEVGGVILGLDAADAVREAHAIILERARRLAPEARLSGVLVSPMEAGAESGAVETILGVQRDPVFGPVVVLGLGGVLVEVLRDVTFRRAPVDEAEAHRMIAELRGAALFDGVRGRPPADTPALARAIAALSRLAVAGDDTPGGGGLIDSIDINPFLVRARGAGAVALDALIVPGTPGHAGEAPQASGPDENRAVAASAPQSPVSDAGTRGAPVATGPAPSR
ncbi:MAG: acetate--CoA ligase family protein [Alkalilacustris sp.]